MGLCKRGLQSASHVSQDESLYGRPEALGKSKGSCHCPAAGICGIALLPALGDYGHLSQHNWGLSEQQNSERPVGTWSWGLVYSVLSLLPCPGMSTETGTIAGVASALAMALIGAVSSYISYQQKKFCFSIQRKYTSN